MNNKNKSSFGDYLKEANENRGINFGVKCPFAEFMILWLFKKYGIEKDKKIVDVGAGPGTHLMILSNVGYKNLTAIDREDYFFNDFLKNGFYCHKRDLNFEPLPFDNGSVDVVWSCLVIAHLESPDNFLKEACRVLKPGGIIFIITPDWSKQYKTFWREPTHIHPYDKTGLSRLLLMYGFEVEIYSWGSAFGLGRTRIYRWLPWLGLIGGNILAVGVKQKN